MIDVLTNARSSTGMQIVRHKPNEGRGRTYRQSEASEKIVVHVHNGCQTDWWLPARACALMNKRSEC